MKLSPKVYQHRFEMQVENFIDNFSSVKANQLKELFLAISGGADSVALLLFANQLQKKNPQLKLHVLHFNHQSRPQENLREHNFVQHLCHKLNIFFYSESYKGVRHKEESWRKARYQFFEKIMKTQTLFPKQSQLWLAHHLDDSWEWSMMQQCKSGNLLGSLGIPVQHKHIFRPFLCVSKNHIRHYLASLQQDYLEDSSNQNTQYERNWWRIHVLKSLKKKYPQLLKHYVQRSMELGLKLKVINRQTSEAQLIVVNAFTHMLLFHPHDNVLHSSALIKKSLHLLSGHDRMKLYKQLRVLMEAYKNKKKGPIYFSGGVRAFIAPLKIILTSDKNFSN